MSKLDIKKLGSIKYKDALDLMLDLREKRQKNLVSDTVLMLEHAPVITTGRRDASEDLLKTTEELKDKGIQYLHSDRGGKLTYHGPGQLVVYFVLDIIKRAMTVEQLVCQSLGLFQEYLQNFSVNAVYDKENPGLWVGSKKIASAGFHIQKGVTTHGVSFNIDNDLEVYNYFIPCGIQDKGVTRLADLVNTKVSVKDVIVGIESGLTKAFG